MIKLKNYNSSLPNMSNTIQGWFLDITIELVERVMIDADFKNKVTKVIKTRGVVQPAKAEMLNIIDNGNRSWQYLTLHCLPNANFRTNQYIKYDDVIYKILDKKDYSKYGYVEYTMVESFEVNNVD